MTEDILIENNTTESFTMRAFGFWFLGAIGLIAFAQIVRIIILNSDTSVFLNDKFAFSLNIPIFISYALYSVVFFAITRYLIVHWIEIGPKLRTGLLLILSGGVSNLVERLWFGHVVDYIYISNGVLNLADFYIIVGMIVVLISRPHRH